MIVDVSKIAFIPDTAECWLLNVGFTIIYLSTRKAASGELRTDIYIYIGQGIKRCCYFCEIKLTKALKLLTAKIIINLDEM